MPKVSVVVPNFNHARFLARRLDSILHQTYRDFDVCYLDDASTDQSADVFAAYAQNPRIRALVNAQNSGSPFVQWNRGVRETKGEYVWIAESDDDADPRLLETLVAKLDAHPNVGLAYCQSLRVDEHDRVLYSNLVDCVQVHPTRWLSDFVANGPDECACFMPLRNTVPNASAVLFRRAVFDAAGGAAEEWRLSGDWVTWCKLMLAADVAFCAAPLNRFRTHTGTVRFSSGRNGLEFVENYRILRWLRGRVPITPAVWNRACQELCERWLRAALLSRLLPPAQMGLLLRTAFAVDPLVPVRVLRTLSKLPGMARRALLQKRT